RVVASTSSLILRDTLTPLLMDLPNTSLDVAARHSRTPRTSPSAQHGDAPLGGSPAAPRAVQVDMPLDDARLGGELPELARDLSGADMAELLVVLAQQSAALKLVWEAHMRGAITLPDGLEGRVEHVRRRVPRFLSATAP
ncbi:MAG TPA: hypothetical protein VMM77_01745, partial [Gemmatimonadaceae bacterium]|nr:hypothetical protein [Gemmatimonadaceae bacterium]